MPEKADRYLLISLLCCVSFAVALLPAGSLGAQAEAPGPQEPAAPASAKAADTAALAPDTAETGEKAAAATGAAGAEAGGAEPGREAALEARVQQLSERVEELETAQFQQVDVMASQPSLSIYGFMDFGFHKFFTNEDSTFRGVFPREPFFVLQQLNLYFSGRMSEEVSALAELRFTLMPHGTETDFAAGSAPYQRIDNRYKTTYSGEFFEYGGVGIERAHVIWQPTDYFGILAGRFLTPVGIWNVDHGSPVLIPIRPPYALTQEVVITRQTGLQLFGRLFPANQLYFDYAFTFSNGRGPAESVIDYDANKGMGLRLKLSHETDNLTASFGGYGYVGDSSDITKAITTIDPFRIEAETIEEYTEYSGALDLLLELHGVRFQVEFYRSLIRYDVRPLRDMMRGMPGYQPDHVKTDVYGLLAYTLPLEELLGAMLLTPYVMLEYGDIDDTADHVVGLMYVGGINFKPTPHWVVKAEYVYKATPNLPEEDFSIISAQTAVSF